MREGVTEGVRESARKITYVRTCTDSVVSPQDWCILSYLQMKQRS